MPVNARTTPRWTFQTGADGRVRYAKNADFVAWFRQHGSQLTNAELARHLAASVGRAVPLTQAARVRDHLGLPQNAATQKRAWAERANCAPQPQSLRLLGPSDAEFFVPVTGDCLVTSDWHVPHHHEELVDQLIAVAQRLGIRQLVINGDFLNEDAFSRWKAHPFNVGWKVEKQIAQALLERLCETFDRIYYILDNHDRRIIATHERSQDFDEADLLDLLVTATTRGKIRASIYYHYVIVNKTWRVTSPKEYRRQKLALANRVAQMQHMHTIVGGDHLFGLGMDDSGRYVIASNMCMVNQAEVPYVRVKDTTYPNWNPGFYAIIENRLYPFPWHPDLWPTWWEHVDAAAMRTHALKTSQARPLRAPREQPQRGAENGTRRRVRVSAPSG